MPLLLRKIKLGIFVIFLFSSGIAYSQEDTLIVRNFLEFQHVGKFQEAMNLADTDFQKKVTPQALAQIWKSLVQQFGEYKGIKQLKAVKKGAFTVLTATVEYDRALVDLQHTLTSENKIAGFFVVKHEAKTASQEPVAPFPYYSENVTFKNDKAGITLAGTLTLPAKEGTFPVVVLISGSGAQNRDEEIFGHKPFLVLSDYLTRNGIAVLRYDDRGTAASGGDFSKATTADFATDVEAAVQYLQSRKEVDPQKIGLIGHSEGGAIAAMVAARNSIVNFIVLLAGPGIPGDKILLSQQRLLGKAAGMPDSILQQASTTNAKLFNIVKSQKNEAVLQSELRTVLSKSGLTDEGIPAGQSKEEFIQKQIASLTSPWLRYFLAYDPAKDLRKVQCPVLALNGEKDLQVPPKENLTAIKRFLAEGGNNRVTTQELKGLNHLFQECTTGLPSEYASIQQTFSPKALKAISDWVLVHVGK